MFKNQNRFEIFEEADDGVVEKVEEVSGSEAGLAGIGAMSDSDEGSYKDDGGYREYLLKIGAISYSDDELEKGAKDYIRVDLNIKGEWYIKGGYSEAYTGEVYNEGKGARWFFEKDPREKAAPFEDGRGNKLIMTTVLVAGETRFSDRGIQLENGTVLIKKSIWERVQEAVAQGEGSELEDGAVSTSLQVCGKLGWPIPEGAAVVKGEPAAEDAYVKSEPAAEDYTVKNEPVVTGEPAAENSPLMGHDQPFMDESE